MVFMPHFILQYLSVIFLNIYQFSSHKNCSYTFPAYSTVFLHTFINNALLKSVAQITEMTKPDHPAAASRAKSADKMVMLPPLFDSTKPEVAKQHYKNVQSIYQ